MAVKELKAVLSVSVIWFDHLSLMLRMRVSCRVLGSLLPFFDCFANRILFKIRTSVIPCSPLWQYFMVMYIYEGGYCFMCKYQFYALTLT